MGRYLLFSVLSCLALFGCEDPGVVGSGFVQTGTEIKVDTLDISNMETQQFSHFSGRLSFISAGRFDDPIFGDLEAIGLLKPGLTSSGGDTMQTGANVKLRLFVNQAEAYGRQEAQAEFDLVELDQVWRGKEWRINDPVQLDAAGPVGSFTLDEQDSVDVTLSSQWAEKYRNFFESEAADRDSLYRVQFPGLAVVPRNSARIIPFYADSSRFIIENPDEDTLEVSPGDWAYSLNRINQQAPPSGTFMTHSTLENVFNFDMQLDREALGSVNISRVELAFFEDADFLANSLPAGAVRPGIGNARLHLAEPGNVPVAIDPGTPVVTGQYNPDDNSIRFNLTTFVNGVLLDEISPSLKFYVTIQTNNGIIRSSALYNNQGPAARKPKLIVTSIQNETEDSSN